MPHPFENGCGFFVVRPAGRTDLGFKSLGISHFFNEMREEEERLCK